MKKKLLICLFLAFSYIHAAQHISTIVHTPTKALLENASQTYTDNVVYVSLDLDTLQHHSNPGKKDAVILHLSTAKEVLIYVKQLKNVTNSENFSWFGENRKESVKAIFSIRNNLLVGTVTVEGTTYKIIPAGSIYKIEKLDSRKQQSFHEDTLNEKEGKHIPEMRITRTLNSVISPATETMNSVDIAILYTQEFKAAHGDATEVTIQNLFDTAQDAYSNSLTGVTLNLVYLGELPQNSTLNITSDLGNTLAQLSEDGYAQHIRAVYNADAISVIGKYALSVGNCGLAYKPLNTSSTMTDAFSVVLYGTDSGYYCSDLTLAHEIGHNFACSHDADHATTSMYPYAYGYDIFEKFATIMSYDSPEIHYFSNPDIHDSVYNLPIGNSTNANNARTIMENGMEIANNSEEISEALEENDIQNQLSIDAYLSTKLDRDSYTVYLGGETTFSANNVGYGCWYFYINIYDEAYNLVFSSDANSGTGCDASAQVTLPNGEYKMMVFNNGWQGGDNQHYLIDIESDYQSTNNLTSVLTYLLF